MTNLLTESLEHKGSKSFSALRNRDFRVLWIGAILSHIGDEFQLVAVSWLVLVITNSPLLLGITSMLQGLPRLFFGILGGIIADRLNRYRVLVFCQAMAMFFAFFLAFLVLSGKIQFWHILILLPVFGFLKSVFDITRQVYVFDLVGREVLMNAIALYSSGMSVARIIGPSLAGILIGIWGVGWCLFINGVSFIAILISLFMLPNLPSSRKQDGSHGPFQDLTETFAYLKQNKTLLILLAVPLSYLLFGLPSHVMLPIFARYILNVGASGYGFLMGAIGAGAVIGGVGLASLGDLNAKGRWLLLALLIYGFLLILFSFSSWFSFSLFLLFLVGIAEIFSRTINMTLVQLLSPDELRGKIMGVRMLERGMKPLGAFLMGAGASLFGAPLALAMGAGICAFIAFTLLAKSPRIRRL